VEAELAQANENEAVTSKLERPGLRERKKQRTRELIEDAALELFLERGFDAVTIADVAERADVDVKTIYNYFPSKPDLVYHRLEELKDSLLVAVRSREPGESILKAFSRFLLDVHGFLGDDQATAKLRAVSKMILVSPALLAHEEQVYARFTAALADLLAAETQARPADLEPSLAAYALIGLHRSLLAYVRGETLAGTPNATLARRVRAQAKGAVATLERGFGDYGVAAARTRESVGER
jgi:AcrR family transcriptional regulator